MFELEPGLMIWTVISFVLLLFLLKRFAYKPLLDVLEKREKDIRSSIEEAQKTRKEAGELFENYKKQLDAAQAEVKNIIDEGRAIAENVKKEILDKASEEANQVLKQTKEQIEREKERAIIELQGRVADLSVMIASKVIQKTLSKEEHLKLVGEHMSKIEGYDGEG